MENLLASTNTPAQFATLPDGKNTLRRLVLRLRIHFAALILLLAPAGSAHSQADEIDPVRYAQVKAAFILNIVRYTEWPKEAFEDETSPIRIVVLGDDPMTPQLRRAIEDVRINDRRIAVRQLHWPQPAPGRREVDEEVMERFQEQLGAAHLLYIAAAEYDRLSNVLEIIGNEPILTVSDVPGFAERGGMLGLFVQDGRVQFNANVGRLRECEVNISSRVLRLAHAVIDKREANTEP